MIPEAGQRLGPYEILGRLGSGGMGLVFRAWDERLHREVAVKLLHDNYTMPGTRERFLQEARAASALNHPNICTVFDIGDQRGNPYLVMELLEGETVRSRIERGALSSEEIVRYALEISDALGAAHSKGIVHRDIKPANIFLVKMPNGKSQAKVLDFGLAKIGLEVGGGWESRTLDLTLSGATVGTVAYMSPEQARGESLDVRSDLFSLGVVLYEMATRRVPFEGTTSALMFVQLFSRTPDSVSTWNESIPRELERIILKLLAKDRNERFQTTTELREALTRAGGKLGRGGWLHKGSAPVVPLVRAYDPVAPHKGPRLRSGPGRGDTPASLMSRLQAAAWSDANRSVPSTLGTGEDHGIDPKGPRPVQTGALAVESSGTHTVPRTDHKTDAWNTSNGDADLESLSARISSARSRFTITQLERGSLDVDLQGVSARPGTEGHFVKKLVAETKKTRVRIVVVAVAVVVAAAGVSLLARSGMFRPMVLKPSDHLLLTVVHNRTGDKTLDGTVMQGLEIALHQSRTLNVLGGEAYRAGLRQLEPGSAEATTVPVQSIAQKVGARAYLYGEITGSEAPYTISVDVLRTDSNDKIASLEETAASKDEIPAAISKLAKAVRTEVSEDHKSETRRSIPLSQEASGNLEALHAFAEGEAARQSGRAGDALKFYREAVGLDPRFVQAQMRLAWLFREERAEVASANAAELARGAASHASEGVKLLAQFCYEMNAGGSVERATKAIREYVARYPLSVDGRRGLALALRTQGLMSEALVAAQHGYEGDVFDAETYAEAERELIGMDRYGSALELDSQAERVGAGQSTDRLTAAYLDGNEDVVANQVDRLRSAIAGWSDAGRAQETYAGLYGYGLYLDNTGKRVAGLELWRTAAAKAGTDSNFAGTQASLLAEGALDHALTESCTVALKMVYEEKGLPRGPVASFDAGLAAALCGDQHYALKAAAALQQDYPQDTAVNEYYIPELQAAAAIGINEPEKALPILIAMGKYDQITLAPYLRGMAHQALGQMLPAIADFQIVLARRGEASVKQGDIYPMAQIGVARAYASSRDKPESVEAYRRFLQLWKGGDQKQPLIVEALARSK